MRLEVLNVRHNLEKVGQCWVSLVLLPGYEHAAASHPSFHGPSYHHVFPFERGL